MYFCNLRHKLYFKFSEAYFQMNAYKILQHD